MSVVVEETANLGCWPTGRMPVLQMGAPGRLETAEVDVPGTVPGHVLVAVSHVGICGTDVHLLSGHSAYVMAGLTSYPIRFGHEWAGRVVAVGDGVDADLVGESVVGEPFLGCGQCGTCRSGRYNLCPERFELGVRGAVPGAAARYLRVPVTNVAVVPEGVAPHLALMAEPLVTVLNAYETAQVQPGERVVVLGTGTIGLLAVQVGAATGCLVDAVGIDEVGLRTATESGARAVLAPDDAPDNAYDVVLDCTGAASIGPVLTRVAAIGARIMEIGIPGRAVDGVDLAAFVTKGLRMQGVLGGVHLLPRALHLIASGVVRPDLLLDQVLPLERADQAFALAAGPGRARPKIVLDLSALADGRSDGAVPEEGGTR